MSNFPTTGVQPETTRATPMSPGDEAPAGTPGTGEGICPECGGRGRDELGRSCTECDGTGKVVTGIGGG